MTERSLNLDFIRWLAALAVVAGHVRSILFEDYNPNVQNPFFKLIYFLTGFGNQAVIIFFVLSGYLIGKSIIDKYNSRTFNLYEYLKARFVRIYIVLIPALLLTYFMDSLGNMIDHTGIHKTCSYVISFQKDPASRLTLLHLTSSLIMLQNIWLPPFGSNGPLWSLAPEFWYYLVFPLIVGLLFLKAQKIKSAIYLIPIIFFFYFIPNWVISYFVIWLCGLVPYFIKKQGLFIKYLLIIAFIITLAYSRIYNLSFGGEFLISILLAFIISNFDNNIEKPNHNRLHKKLASFSYSLYLTHYPLALFLFCFIDEYIISIIKVSMNTFSLFIYIAVIITLYLFSYGFAKITEYKTDKVRRRLP